MFVHFILSHENLNFSALFFSGNNYRYAIAFLKLALSHSSNRRKALTLSLGCTSEKISCVTLHPIFFIIFYALVKVDNLTTEQT